MKKVFLSLSLVFIFALYAWHQHKPGPAPVAYVAPQTRQPVPFGLAVKPPAAGNGNTVPQSTAPAAQPVAQAGLYRNGEYTGSVADAYYGNVQVKAVVSRGRIADVQFLDYPHDRGTSIEINSQAMPYLTSEAIQAQSAQVDVISGATQTSLAFRESLAAALAQASN